MAGKVRQFLHHVAPGVIRPIRILWNEMIGFVFVCLGIIPLPSAYQAYNTNDTFRLMLTTSFSAIMLYFGITSFLKAKKISRS